MELESLAIITDPHEMLLNALEQDKIKELSTASMDVLMKFQYTN
jgi:hypothetical protein